MRYRPPDGPRVVSATDPQTDEERAQAECFVIAVRVGEMWRPYGVTLGTVARDAMLATVAEEGREFRAISLEP